MGYFSTLKEDLSPCICHLPYSSHKEYEELKCPACSLLSFSMAADCGLGCIFLEVFWHS